jgi:hypothetical protein
MPDQTDRGTTEDLEWPKGNLTGGNDSGTAGVDPDKLDEPQGPDRTAQILDEEGGSAGAFPGSDPSMERPLEEPSRRVAHDMDAPPAPDYGIRSSDDVMPGKPTYPAPADRDADDSEGKKLGVHDES